MGKSRFLTLALLGSDAGDSIVLEQALRALVRAELDVALRTERGVRGDRDAESLAVLDEGLLGEVGVDLDLENLGLDARIAQHVVDERALSIASDA